MTDPCVRQARARVNGTFRARRTPPTTTRSKRARNTTAGAGKHRSRMVAPMQQLTTLIDDFLAEQSSLTAVDRFSRAHDEHTGDEPAQARWYRDLLPTAAPGPGQQYAFEVDLDACSGCKACVAACHSLNGLDEGEAWRDVGLLVGTGDNALLQPVTTGCHHCAEPGCLEGCPVDAYVKDDDGIVRHLDDQCIGCSYCTLSCPYEVPQYDRGRGIVRKCDMCHDRLADGEAPACVQACPTEAIRITVVDVEEAGREGWGFTAPDPAATRPTTVFRSSRDLQTDVAPADLHALTPRHGHPPLVIMLVLTQLAIGTFGALELLRVGGVLAAVSAVSGAVLAMVVTGLALVASLAHLGRPQYAWRAVIGLRHSWLSREIVAFGGFAAVGTLHAATLAGWVPWLAPAFTGALATAIGLAAVGTSVMVYVATQRAGWRPAWVTARFGLTTVTLGLATVTALAQVIAATGPATTTVMAAATAALAGLGVVVDLLPLRHAGGAPEDARTRTARLLRGPLWGRVQLRTGAGLLTAALATLAALLLVRDAGPLPAAVALVAAVIPATAAELLARSWFFTAEGSLRMPGAP